jgi:PPOX class probable F420-dependent enzyme
VTSGTCSTIDELPDSLRGSIDDARRALLGTISPDGRPRLVPVCHAVRDSEIVFAIDDKPKSGRPLARVSDIERDPRATLLIDRWSEDWTELAWVRLDCDARIEPPGTALEHLQARYPQYLETPPTGVTIVLRPTHVVWWSYSDS